MLVKEDIKSTITALDMHPTRFKNHDQVSVRRPIVHKGVPLFCQEYCDPLFCLPGLPMQCKNIFNPGFWFMFHVL